MQEHHINFYNIDRSNVDVIKNRILNVDDHDYDDYEYYDSFYNIIEDEDFED
jgi:hypothetical protein